MSLEIEIGVDCPVLVTLRTVGRSHIRFWRIDPDPFMLTFYAAIKGHIDRLIALGKENLEGLSKFPDNMA